LPEGYAWPPRKEDLERLYVVERLSAMKIAKVYGLKYKNPKVAESTILYHLKRNGIKRRDPAEHNRKVTEAMVEEWVRRYQAGESLRTIAGEIVDPVTVWIHLKKRGLVLRDRVEAQILAVTKHERKRFQGDSIEKAYMMGLRYGDLDAVRHGRAVRVRVSTTHPAMAELFESLFSPYGFVHRFPREAEFTGYEWSLECDLDDSFEFLLQKPSICELDRLTFQEFLSFLAGFFDAEGSVFLHRKSSGLAPELNIANTDKEVLNLISQRLASIEILSSLTSWDQRTKKQQFKSVSLLWKLNVWRFECVNRLLAQLALRHPEKTAKKRIALRFVSPISQRRNTEAVREWETLAQQIDDERLKFIEEAKLSLTEMVKNRNKLDFVA
jgi:intein-encoded DNA endonuclease-like protein